MPIFRVTKGEHAVHFKRIEDCEIEGLFTREDVEVLREACVIDFFDGGGVDTDPDADVVLKSLADRIQALLPPEGE